MRDHLVLYVNGTRQTVCGPGAVVTLSDYLRNGLHGRLNGGLNGGLPCAEGCSGQDHAAPRRPGTKVACAEGDCGACTVLVGRPSLPGRYPHQQPTFEYRTIDACIAFVYQMDRCHVITVEGLQHGEMLTDVQTAMVECHGSQCGFCTPGFVMALHGLIEQRNTAQRSAEQQSPQLRTATPGNNEAGHDRFSDEDLRLGLSGNLCRCTGYAQILDAGRSLQAIDMSRFEERFNTTAMLADLVNLGSGPVHVNARQVAAKPGSGSLPTLAPEVYLPNTLDQLLLRRAERPAATLVAGATDLGVQHNHGNLSPTDILVTSGVDALAQLEFDKNDLVIGAAVSWSRIEAFVRERVPEYHQILTRFGSPQIRNAGTLAGNLANASPIADSIPFHYVAGSTIELAHVGGRRIVPIEDFYLGYKQLDLRADEIIVSVRTPLPTNQEYLKLYKISKRRDMDISTVTAAFWVEIEAQSIRRARIAAGGVGPTVLRLRRAETALVGKPLTIETMRAAGRIARDEITPLSDVRGSASYRLQLVENLFVKCFYDLSTTLQPVES